MDLVVVVYNLSKQFPDEERYGLIAQMRRSAVSIPSNIAEGRSRGSRKDFSRFLMIAYGSGAELETQFEIARRLSYISEQQYLEVSLQVSEIMKILNTMISKLK